MTRHIEHSEISLTYNCIRFIGKPSRANFCTAFMPDSEQIEAFGTEFLCRNSVSVEEIQDRRENRKFIIGKSIFSI